MTRKAFLSAVIGAGLVTAGCEIASTNSSHYVADEQNSALVIAHSNAETAKAGVLAAGGIITHDLPILNGVGARLSVRSINNLEDDPRIARIVIDSGEVSSDSTENAISQETADWLKVGLKSAPQNPWLRSVVGKQQHGLTGRGVGLAIIDTGLTLSPANFHRNITVTDRYNAVSAGEPNDINDTTGHGTHLASLLIGAGSEWEGIAPDVSLIVVRAFNSHDEANFLDVIRAIQWVTDNREQLNIRVLNLSISASTELAYHLDPLNRALTAAWNEGLVVVVSAGNQGPETASVTAPGNNPWLISVGAAYQDYDDGQVYVAPFSGRGPTGSGHIKPNIVAPGVNLAGILPPNARRPSNEPPQFTETGLWVTSGASQASAVTAGMVALLLEARPQLSNSDVKCLLANTATPLPADQLSSVSPMAQGRGLINLPAALLSDELMCDERLDGFSSDTIIEGSHRGP